MHVNLFKDQSEMKAQVDPRRIVLSFKVLGKVVLQFNNDPWLREKLWEASPCPFGPLIVVHHVGPMAYELASYPRDSHIHPMFLAFLLRPTNGQSLIPIVALLINEEWERNTLTFLYINIYIVKKGGERAIHAHNTPLCWTFTSKYLLHPTIKF